MRKTLLFDFDGTLFDSLPAVGGAIIDMLKEMGRTEQYSLVDMRKCIGPPLEHSFSVFFGFAGDEIQTCIDIYRRHHSGMLDRYTPYDGIAEALRALKDAGFRLAVATSKWETNARHMLVERGMDGCFDLIAGAADGRTAGKAEVIAYIIDELKLEPSNALMIGDRLYDVEGAAAFGIPTLGVLWGFGTREELTGAGALACVETPRELVDLVTRTDGDCLE